MIALGPMPGRRFKPSGVNIPEGDRHTVTLKARCEPELAARVRAFCNATGLTLAQVLEAGMQALAAQRPVGE